MSIVLGRPGWLGPPAPLVETGGPAPGDPATQSAGPSRPPNLRPTALLGLTGMCSVVIGAVLGGPAFVSNLPGAWFFGTPGGPLGSVSSSSRHAPILSVFLVYGGFVVCVRAWIGLLRLLRAHPVTVMNGVLHENPFYTPADEMLRDLERRRATA